MATAAIMTARLSGALRESRRHYSDTHYSWVQTEVGADHYATSVGKFTKNTGFTMRDPTWSFGYRDVRYRREELLGGEWVGRASTHLFEWGGDGVVKRKGELKVVPSMEEDYAERLTQFYADHHPDTVFDEEEFLVTVHDQYSISSFECMKLLRSFRQGRLFAGHEAYTPSERAA